MLLLSLETFLNKIFTLIFCVFWLRNVDAINFSKIIEFNYKMANILKDLQDWGLDCKDYLNLM